MCESWEGFEYDDTIMLENLTDAELLNEMGSLDFPSILSVEPVQESSRGRTDVEELQIDAAMDESSIIDSPENNSFLPTTPVKINCACNSRFEIICKQQDSQIASLLRALDDYRHTDKQLRNELDSGKQDYEKTIENLKISHKKDITELEQQHRLAIYIGQKQLNQVVALNKQLKERDARNEKAIIIADRAFKTLRDGFNIHEDEQRPKSTNENKILRDVIEISDDEDEVDAKKEIVFLLNFVITKDLYERLAVFAMTNVDIFLRESLDKIIGRSFVFMSANGFIRGIPRPKLPEHIKGSIYKIYRDVVINFQMSFMDLDNKINLIIEKVVIKRGLSLVLSPEQIKLATERLEELKPIHN